MIIEWWKNGGICEELGPDTSLFKGKIAAQTGKPRRKTKGHEENERTRANHDHHRRGCQVVPMARAWWPLAAWLWFPRSSTF